MALNLEQCKQLHKQMWNLIIQSIRRAQKDPNMIDFLLGKEEVFVKIKVPKDEHISHHCFACYTANLRYTYLTNQQFQRGELHCDFCPITDWQTDDESSAQCCDVSPISPDVFADQDNLIEWLYAQSDKSAGLQKLLEGAEYIRDVKWSPLARNGKEG